MIWCIAALTLLKLQESYKTLKSVFCIAIPLISWISKLLSLSLIKLHHWKRRFSANVGLKSINLLFCSNPAISVPRSSKLVILCIAALTLQKPLFMKNSNSLTLIIKLHSLKRRFSANVGLKSINLLVLL